MSHEASPRTDAAALRRDYRQRGLDESDLAADPFTQFETWFREAVASSAVTEPNAMVLSTVSPEGEPHARIVLLKDYGPDGFTFFTNLASEKARDLAANPRAALTFGWLELERQVRIEGPVSQTPREAVEAYFRSRPRGSRLGAWASRQSEVIPGREILEAAMAEVELRFPHEVPAPGHWGGYCVAPRRIEFWQGRPNRLHDRLRYRRVEGQTSAQMWAVERVSP